MASMRLRVTDLQRGERVAGERAPLWEVPCRRPVVPRITSWAPPLSLLKASSAFHAMLNPHVRAEAGAGSLASSAEGGPAGRSRGCGGRGAGSRGLVYGGSGGQSASSTHHSPCSICTEVAAGLPEEPVDRPLLAPELPAERKGMEAGVGGRSRQTRCQEL